MFRKSIFLGLTVMLSAAFVTLIVKSRKEERKTVAPAEIVKQSTPSATRLLLPEDLEIIEVHLESMKPESDTKGDLGSKSARHRIVIRNRGTVRYEKIKLEFAYLSSGGRMLGKRSELIPVVLPPGETVTAGDIVIEDVPANASRSRARILYAEIGASEKPAEQAP